MSYSRKDILLDQGCVLSCRDLSLILSGHLPIGDLKDGLSTCGGVDSAASVSRPVITHSSGSPLSSPRPTVHTHHPHWETGMSLVGFLLQWEIGNLLSTLSLKVYLPRAVLFKLMSSPISRQWNQFSAVVLNLGSALELPRELLKLWLPGHNPGTIKSDSQRVGPAMYIFIVSG